MVSKLVKIIFPFLVILVLTFIPFLELKQYKSDYFGTGKNGLATITYMDGISNERFNYNNRKLDEEEAKKNFTLEYVKLKDILKVLEDNRQVSKQHNKEFITTEMIYVISEYQKYLKENNLNIDEMEK